MFHIKIIFNIKILKYETSDDYNMKVLMFHSPCFVIYF